MRSPLTLRVERCRPPVSLLELWPAWGQPSTFEKSQPAGQPASRRHRIRPGWPCRRFSNDHCPSRQRIIEIYLCPSELRVSTLKASNSFLSERASERAILVLSTLPFLLAHRSFLRESSSSKPTLPTRSVSFAVHFDLRDDRVVSAVGALCAHLDLPR